MASTTSSIRVDGSVGWSSVRCPTSTPIKECSMRLTTDPLHESIGILVDGKPIDASDVQCAIETSDAEAAIESLLGIVNVLRRLSGKEAVTVKGAGQVRRRGPKQPRSTTIVPPAGLNV